jgi:hypothetical protein
MRAHSGASDAVARRTVAVTHSRMHQREMSRNGRYGFGGPQLAPERRATVLSRGDGSTARPAVEGAESDIRLRPRRRLGRRGRSIVDRPAGDDVVDADNRARAGGSLRGCDTPADRARPVLRPGDHLPVASQRPHVHRHRRRRRVRRQRRRRLPAPRQRRRVRCAGDLLGVGERLWAGNGGGALRGALRHRPARRRHRNVGVRRRHGHGRPRPLERGWGIPARIQRESDLSATVDFTGRIDC